jgi:hypothetical protein
LNAWVEDRKQIPPRRSERPKSIELRLAEAVVDGPPPNPQRERSHFIELLEKLHDCQADRSADIRRGATEHYPNEEDLCLELQYLTAANLRLEGLK